MPVAPLTDRGVVRVSGPDARSFLDGLVTCDMDRVAPGRTRLGALLTPQGKILFDFIIFEGAEESGFHLDVRRAYAPDLARRLGFYKLRAKVTIEDVSDGFTVLAGWDDALLPDTPLAAPDPRLPALGWRAIVAAEGQPSTSPRRRGEGRSPLAGAEASAEREGEGQGDTRPASHPRLSSTGLLPAVALSPQAGRGEGTADAYDSHRIALGVPEGGRDFMFGDAFPHEALMDQLHGVDFDKGCYVGQEVVSRMQHRGTARNRIVPLVYLDGFVAEAGVPVTAGERTIGTTGTGAAGRGLALLRLDRAADALTAGEPILAGGLAVRLEKPAWIGFPFPGEAASPAA